MLLSFSITKENLTLVGSLSIFQFMQNNYFLLEIQKKKNYFAFENYIIQYNYSLLNSLLGFINLKIFCYYLMKTIKPQFTNNVRLDNSAKNIRDRLLDYKTKQNNHLYYFANEEIAFSLFMKLTYNKHLVFHYINRSVNIVTIF